MKMRLAVLVFAVLVFLVACGNDDSAMTTNTTTVVSKQTATPTVVTSSLTTMPTNEPTTVPTTAMTTKPTDATTTKATTVTTTEPTTKSTTVPTTEPTTVSTTELTTKPNAKPTTVPTTKPTTVVSTQTTTPTSVAPSILPPRATSYVSGEPDENINWDSVFASIPSNGYENYLGMHNKPLSATLYKDGKITEIDINDPRLIQLLNFYHNAVYYRIHAYSQGPATEYYEEVKDASFKLELIFVQNMTDDSIETSFDKMVIIDTYVFGIRTNIPFGDYDYSVYSRNPLYYQEGINLLELFGF